TETMALLPGSPAIGKGIAVAGLTTDQRGFPLDSPAPDIGAFQTQANLLVVNTTIDGFGSPSGDLDLRQAINLAQALGGSQTITFAAGLSGTIALSQGPLAITSGLDIQGPGANVLTIDAGGQNRVLSVTGGVSEMVSISGLTISGGSAATG